jgi:hypothetical protein
MGNSSALLDQLERLEHLQRFYPMPTTHQTFSSRLSLVAGKKMTAALSLKSLSFVAVLIGLRNGSNRRT